MMRKAFLYLLILLAIPVCAQVKIDIRVDSLDRLVGQHSNITLEVTADAKAAVAMPEYKPGEVIADEVELVEASHPDTTWLNDGKVMTIKRTYTVTSFADSTRICNLPPMRVEVNGEEHLSNRLNIRYETIDVDTIHSDQFCAPKTIMKPELTWEEWKVVTYIIALCLLLLATAGYLFYRYHTGRPIIKLQLRREKKKLPHQVALDEINRIKNEKKWADEDSKEYYTLLTDALRTYIADRYGFNAKEMTSAEIIENLMRETDEERMKEMRQLFATADLVKFAKAQTMINENDMNLVNAIEFIQGTKLEIDPNAVPEPDPEIEEQKRTKRERRVLLAVIIALGIAAACLLGWAAWETYDLLA